MLGPVALDFLHDHFTRRDRSLDAVTTMLQVIIRDSSVDDRIDTVIVGIHEAHR